MQYVFVYGTLRAGEANDINRAAERHDLATPGIWARRTCAVIFSISALIPD